MPPITGLHIEATNICTLKCPGCARTRFIEQWPQHWKNHSIDANELLRFLDIDLKFAEINFCGNYGDPIYHPDFIGLISKLKKQGCRISVTTNGSHRSIDWWQSLCEILDDEDSIRFSIDGMPDNFTQYRINADWKSIKEAIQICVASQVKTIWKFIPFAFNESSIAMAQKLSQDLGIDEFLVDASDRYDEKTQHLVPSQNLVGNRLIYQNQFKTHQTVLIDPKCHRGREHFITATGHYSPCCFVADHRFYYKTMFGKNRREFDIRNNTLTGILSQTKIIKFYQDIEIESPGVCQFNCPKLG